MELGLIYIYCGDGKGKIIVVMGFVLRVVGYNKKVLLI